MAKKSGHPLGVTGKMLFGAAITTVGMGLSAGVAAADPQPADTHSTQDSRPAPATDVRTMTDQELSNELSRVAGKDSLRHQEVVTEMKARGGSFWEASPAPDGIGISGSVPVRKGVSVTGTIAYDSYSGSWYVSGGVKLGTPGGPQFTGIAPKPDGLNANGTVKLDLGDNAEFSGTLSLNLSPEGEVTGSYKAKGQVTTPDGTSYETDVTVTRNADGTFDVSLPDGYSTSTKLPGGGTIDTTTPVDPTEERKTPEVKGPAPKTEEQPQQQQQQKPGGWTDWFDWFDWSGGVSIDKEIRPAPQPLPTPEEVERAKEGWAEQQRAAKEQQDAWRAQNRPESQYREAQERAQQRADAAEANRRAAMPDRDHDGVPDAEDSTWNQNDTDPTSSDVGDGPEGGKGYPSDRVDTPEPTSPPASSDPNADHDKDGVPDRGDATWNQNDTDPTSSDVGDGPEGGEGYAGPDTDGDGLTGSADATPNQNDTDPSSTDIGDGPEGGNSNSNSNTNTGANANADVDGDGLTGSADATPNQNDTDPSSTDIGDGPEGGEGYGGSDSGSDSGLGSGSGSDSGFGSDTGSDSGADSTADPGGYSGSDSGSDSSADSSSNAGNDSGSNAGTDSGSDSGGYSGADSSSDSGGYSGSDAGTDTGSDTGTDSGGYSGNSGSDTGSDSSTSDSGGYGDADGDGLSGSADSTPNQNDTDPSSTDVGDGPEGNAGYGGFTDTGGYGSDAGDGSCACF